jgi:hypothetical protein
MVERPIRTFARIVSFRLIALAITAFFVGWSVAVTLQLILLCVHYSMERLWLKTTWGLQTTP